MQSPQKIGIEINSADWTRVSSRATHRATHRRRRGYLELGWPLPFGFGKRGAAPGCLVGTHARRRAIAWDGHSASEPSYPTDQRKDQR